MADGMSMNCSCGLRKASEGNGDGSWLNYLQLTQEREAAGNIRKHVDHLMDHWLPDRQAALCEIGLFDLVMCSAGATRGTVVSPFLFTLHTSDFKTRTTDRNEQGTSVVDELTMTLFFCFFCNVISSSSRHVHHLDTVCGLKLQRMWKARWINDINWSYTNAVFNRSFPPFLFQFDL